MISESSVKYPPIKSLTLTTTKPPAHSYKFRKIITSEILQSVGKLASISIIISHFIKMKFQENKMLVYIQMAKTRSAMIVIMLVMCTTLIFYSPFNTTSQVKKIEAIEKLQRWPLYVFGDSLYDTGMGFYVDKGPAADSYPYGTTYFKRPAGRFSDGRLIPDFIAQFANLPFPEPYRSPNLTDYTKSVNFADAAAGVLVDGRNNTLNLKLQTEFFVEMVGKMEKQYGKEKARKLVSNAVLLFNIGSNDYVDIWIKVPRPHNSSFVNSFVNKILGNFTVSITSMYNQGARKFAFQNYGPMGCLPLFLKETGECAEDLTELAKIHNDRFAALAKTWARQLPGFQYVIYDFYTSLTSHIENGAKYGFKETKWACCGSGQFHSKFTCMERANFTLCDDIPSHLFFDPAHPTEEGDRQFALEFWNGPPSLVAPTNIKGLFGRENYGR